MVDWKGMCLDKMENTKVKNVLKLVHGWQNDGQQRDLFYGNNEEHRCSAGRGKWDSWLYYIKCKSPRMNKAHNDRRVTLHTAHKKLKTAGIIYDAFTQILGYLRKGGSKPIYRSRFKSKMDTVVRESWVEQELIGWD